MLNLANFTLNTKNETTEAKIEKLCREAVLELFNFEFDPIIRISNNSNFGDYQCNGVMAFAKSKDSNPVDIAEQIAAYINNIEADLFSKPCEVAGPGFINFFINDKEVFSQATNVDFPKVSKDTKVLVEYGSENIAKELHVGHLRGQIIGDAIARTLEKVEVTVIRDNHIGDWGTQFGMLIELVLEKYSDLGELDSLGLDDLDQYYVEAKQKFSSDDEFARKSRARVALLQSGDETSLNIWKSFYEVSVKEILRLYKELGITLLYEDFRGESFYNDLLDSVCEELVEKGIAKYDDGALCIYLDGENDKDGNPFGLIIKKSDGGYNYASTDLATIKYRVSEIKANEYLYIVDSRQSQHLRMVINAAVEAGWIKNGALKHINYGTLQSEDGGPFKTRDGKNIKLKTLVDEAVSRAESLIVAKNPGILDDPERLDKLSKSLGIGALKYGDLSSQRIKNYVFNWDRMISFDGNTAPYIQYSHARICSLLNKLSEAGVDIDQFKMTQDNGAAGEFMAFQNENERELAKKLTNLVPVIVDTLMSYEPHKICTYLFSLAQTFTSFYENSPVLKASHEEQSIRIPLILKTQYVLSSCLNILGIDAPERL